MCISLAILIAVSAEPGGSALLTEMGAGWGAWLVPEFLTFALLQRYQTLNAFLVRWFKWTFTYVVDFVCSNSNTP